MAAEPRGRNRQDEAADQSGERHQRQRRDIRHAEVENENGGTVRADRHHRTGCEHDDARVAYDHDHRDARDAADDDKRKQIADEASGESAEHADRKHGPGGAGNRPNRRFPEQLRHDASSVVQTALPAARAARRGASQRSARS